MSKLGFSSHREAINKVSAKEVSANGGLASPPADIVTEDSVTGFTLIEAIVVIIIIGILATIALPQFGRTKERALGNEAKANLKLIAAAEKIYRMESASQDYSTCECYCGGTGATCCNNTTNGCNSLLKLSLTTQNWAYAVNATGTGASAAFTAKATRLSGSYSGCFYTVTNTTDEPTTTTCP